MVKLDPRVRGGDEDPTTVIPVETGIQMLRYLKVLWYLGPRFREGDGDLTTVIPV